MADNQIAKRIINDAQEIAKASVSEARVKAAYKLKSTQKKLEEEQEAKLRAQKNLLDEQFERQNSIAEIEQRQHVLKDKFEILNKVFETVKDELLKLNKTAYTAFIKALIIKNCQDGDTVVVSKKDEKRLTAEFIKAAGTLAKKKLTRSIGDGFDGGIILGNKNYDLPLTLDDILHNFRAKREAEVAKILFE